MADPIHAEFVAFFNEVLAGAYGANPTEDERVAALCHVIARTCEACQAVRVEPHAICPKCGQYNSPTEAQ